MLLPIGNLIQKKLKESGLSNAEFARKLNCTSQNVVNILNRDSLDTALLMEISLILNHSFFLYYEILVKNKQSNLAEKMVLAEAKKAPEKENGLSLKEEMEYLNLHINYLKEINQLLNEKLKES
jgi:transcriptional regulator with XRE-family HTH domain